MIEQLKQRRSNRWIEIQPDEGEAILLPVGSVPGWWQAGFSVPEDEWQRTARMAQYHDMYDRACRMLARREHFAEEIRRKLRQRSQESDLVDEVIKVCRENGFINDERAAETNTEQLLAKGPIGAPKLMRELLRRGCERQLAERMVAEHCRETDNFATSLDLLERRQRNFETKLQQYRRRLSARHEGRGLEFEIRNRLSAAMMNFLATKGFADSDARQAIRVFVDRLMEADQG